MLNDDQYRRAVQGRVEELLSKRHNTSTSRLVVEAVVEGMKLYRSYKEQEKEEGRRKSGGDEKEGQKRHSKGCCRGENEKDGHRRRHDHIHCGRTDGSLREYHDGPRSRDGHSNYYPGDKNDDVHDSKRVSKEGDQLMGGANGYQNPGEQLVSGPRPRSVPEVGRDISNSRRTTPSPGRLTVNVPQAQSKEQRQSLQRKDKSKLETKRATMAHNAHQRGKQEAPLSRHQSRAHHRHSDTCAEKAGVSHSSTPRQRGPDGTSFGNLPKYKSKTGVALSFCDHLVATYRQIKAEQDAGYRAKGYIEKVLEGTRKKRPDRMTSKGKQGCDRNTPRMDEPHSAAELEITSETSSPMMPRARLVGRDVNNARTSLLESIQSGVRLRRVASLDKEDKSTNASAGKVLYEATEDSREVEEREHG